MATTQNRIEAAGGLEIRVDVGDPYLIALEGELDSSNADAVEAELTLAEASAAKRIVLNLSRLTFIDSSGLRILVMAKRRSDADADRLRIRPGKDQVTRVMALTGIDSYLRVEDDEPPPASPDPPA